MDYDGGYCPCCGEARTEYYAVRLWTCAACDSWLLTGAHAFHPEPGRVAFEPLPRRPLGPMDEVEIEVSRYVGRALCGSDDHLRSLRAVRDE